MHAGVGRGSLLFAWWIEGRAGAFDARCPGPAGGGLDSLIGNLNVSNYHENCRQLCTETRANGSCDVARRLWRQADKVRVVAAALAW